jgi:PAS domain S-box-containing protein
MASAKTVPIRHAEVAHALPMSAAARARQLEQVLEQIGEAIIVKDLDAVVTYWNREAASLYGYSAEDAVGRPLRKLHAADLSEAEYARLLERVRSGKPTTSTTERRKKSGDAVRVASRRLRCWMRRAG